MIYLIYTISHKKVNKMDNRFEIFYVRHALTQEGNFADRDKCDIDLDETGEKQIELLSERLKGREFTAVFSSPLVRAVKTASAVCKKLSNSPVIEILPQLCENGTTENYFGQDENYLKRYYEKIIINNDLPLYFKTETEEQNNERAKTVIDYFKNRFTYGDKIIVFAHGSFGTNFLSNAVGIKDRDFIFSLNNTSISKIKYTPDGMKRISFANDFSHLRPLMPDYEFDV